MSSSPLTPVVPTLLSPLLTRGPHKFLELVQYSCLADGVVAFHQLRLADRFTDTQPQWTAQALAYKEGWNTGRLYQLLNAVHFVGLVAVHQPEGQYAVAHPEQTALWSLTDDGALLRSSHPCKLGYWMEWCRGPYISASQADLATAVSTQAAYVPGLQKHADTLGCKQQWMAFIAQEPSQRHIYHTFSQGLTGLSEAEGPAIADTYHEQLSTTHTLIDIGGGLGGLSASLAQSFPQLHAVNADLPSVIDQARAAGEAERRGVSNRCSLIDIDFFDAKQLSGPIAAATSAAVKEQKQVVLSMKHVLHDWAPEQCLSILTNLRSAVLAVTGLAPLVKLAVVEMTYLDQSHPTAINTNWVTAHMDLFMIGTGGAQRSEAQWTSLLKEAGWTVVRLYAAGAPIQVLEAVVAQ